MENIVDKREFAVRKERWQRRKRNDSYGNTSRANHSKKKRTCNPPKKMRLEEILKEREDTEIERDRNRETHTHTAS